MVSAVFQSRIFPTEVLRRGEAIGSLEYNTYCDLKASIIERYIGIAKKVLLVGA